VRCRSGIAQWLLRRLWSGAERASGTTGGAHGADTRDPYGQPGNVWRATGARRTQRPGRALLSEHRGQVDAAGVHPPHGHSPDPGNHGLAQDQLPAFHDRSPKRPFDRAPTRTACPASYEAGLARAHECHPCFDRHPGCSAFLTKWLGLRLYAGVESTYCANSAGTVPSSPFLQIDYHQRG